MFSMHGAAKDAKTQVVEDLKLLNATDKAFLLPGGLDSITQLSEHVFPAS